MATIKSNTDLEQSKKLAEILQLESADNVIVSFGSREGTTTLVMPKETLDAIRTPLSDIREVIPCWSLTALLGVLTYTSLHKTFIGWRCDSYSKGVTSCILGDTSDNPIDTCYEMIIKLHELNLL